MADVMTDFWECAGLDELLNLLLVILENLLRKSSISQQIRSTDRGLFVLGKAKCEECNLAEPQQNNRSVASRLALPFTPQALLVNAAAKIGVDSAHQHIPNEAAKSAVLHSVLASKLREGPALEDSRAHS